MSAPRLNKYRDAIDLLQKGRDFLVESIADEILDQGDGLLEGSYQFNELLETQGTRLHFLTLLMGQLEQSAETLEESKPAPAPPPARSPARKKSRAKPKRLQQKMPTEGSPEDL
jgi:hypothetical protein